MQTIPSIDLYRELEVDPAATAETIDVAWKSLLKRHHPDVAPDAPMAVERVKRLNLAHEWLSDPRKRAAYDRSRRRPRVVVIPSPGPLREERHAGRMPHVMTPQRPRRGTAPTPDPAPPPDHNPYAEYDQPRRRPPAVHGFSPSELAPRGGGRRMVPLIGSMVLASVVVVVAVSSFLGARNTPTVAAESTTQPGAGDSGTNPSASVAPQVGALASAVTNPRGLPPPDLASVLPPECRGPGSKPAVQFETTIESDVPALVFVVSCNRDLAYGPLVFVPATTGWDLRAKGGPLPAGALAGIAGSITASSADEFGIVWERSNGIDRTLSLYRLSASGMSRFWESGEASMEWSLGIFGYRPSLDGVAPGQVVVTAADMSTGTPNCATCSDHQLLREVYQWKPVLGVGRLVRTAAEPAGPGPSPTFDAPSGHP